MTYRFILCAFSAALLAGCSSGSVKDTLGLNRSAPDEFRVVSRPPLSVPPQFSLRPPLAPGEEPEVTPAHKQAESLILGNDAAARNGNTFQLPGNDTTAPVRTSSLPSTSKLSPESNFLSRAGATGSDPNVRRAIEQDRAGSPVEEEDAWWDILSTTPGKKDSTVNAKSEAERIRQNKDEGKPVTEGETPEVKGRDTGVLGRILDY